MVFDFTTEVWRYPGDAAWHFATVPLDVSEEIHSTTDHLRRGFGSVRVEVTIGTSTWRTSVFPQSKSGTYVVPVKVGVRRKEGLDDGSPARILLRVIEA